MEGREPSNVVTVMNMTVIAIEISGAVEHDEAASLSRLCCKATSMTQEPAVPLSNSGMDADD